MLKNRNNTLLLFVRLLVLFSQLYCSIENAPESLDLMMVSLCLSDSCER